MITVRSLDPHIHRKALTSDAPIQVHLKSPQTIINAKAFDSRSSENMMALVGFHREILAIPKGNIAVIIMEPARAKEYLGK